MGDLKGLRDVSEAKTKEEMKAIGKENTRIMNEWNKRRKYEIAHSIRPVFWDVDGVVHGLRKDYVRFMKDIPKIAKSYSLEAQAFQQIKE